MRTANFELKFEVARVSRMFKPTGALYAVIVFVPKPRRNDTRLVEICAQYYSLVEEFIRVSLHYASVYFQDVAQICF